MSATPVPRAGTETQPNGPHARVVITIASLGFFLITLDISIVNVALARIRDRARRRGRPGSSGSSTATPCCSLPCCSSPGNLSDRIGAKRALALGIVVFAVTSAACAGAPTIGHADRGPLRPGRRRGGHAAGLDGAGPRGLPRPAPPGPRPGGLGRRWRGRRPGRAAPRRAAHHASTGGGCSPSTCRSASGCSASSPWSRPRRPGPRPSTGPVRSSPCVALAALIYGLIEGGHAGFTRPLVVVALVVAVVGAGRLRPGRRPGSAHPMMPLEPVPRPRVPDRAAGRVRLHGRQLRQRLRHQPLPAAAPRA